MLANKKPFNLLSGAEVLKRGCAPQNHLGSFLKVCRARSLEGDSGGLGRAWLLSIWKARN